MARSPVRSVLALFLSYYVQHLSRLSSRVIFVLRFHCAAHSKLKQSLLITVDRLKPRGISSCDNLQVVVEAILHPYLPYSCSNFFSSLISWELTAKDSSSVRTEKLLKTYSLLKLSLSTLPE